ncbi:MAG: hypothetical protein JWL86_5831 [Rhizobium sp.]|nr:hypothetical protein [Rhizobium sp.]
MNRETSIRNLLVTIDAYLAHFDRPGINDVRAGIARWKDGPLRDVTPARIGPVRHVDAALDWMTTHGDKPLAAAIEAAFPYLEWVAYDPYPRELIGDLYAENHTMASLIGSGGQIGSEDFDLGLFGFGPDILYRDHQHAAPEMYAPLTGPHGWRFKSGDALDWHSSHQPVWNEAWAPHAFKSGAVPFLCVYGWTRDIDVPAKMIVEPDWAELEAATAA